MSDLTLHPVAKIYCLHSELVEVDVTQRSDEGDSSKTKLEQFGTS